MKAQFYVKFRPVWRGSKVIGVRATGVTKKRPRDDLGGFAAVRFSVDFDPAIWAHPEVTATIKAGDAEVVGEVLPPLTAKEAERE